MTCYDEICSIADGASSDFDLSAICSDYSGQFSALGLHIEAYKTGSTASRTCTCLGFDPYAFGTGAAVGTGVDFQPNTASLKCNKGILTMEFEGTPAPFTATPPMENWVVSGLEILQCGSCGSGKAKVKQDIMLIR